METRVFQGMEGEVKLYLHLLLVEWRIFSSFSIPFGMKFGKFFIGAKGGRCVWTRDITQRPLLSGTVSRGKRVYSSPLAAATAF